MGASVENMGAKGQGFPHRGHKFVPLLRCSVDGGRLEQVDDVLVCEEDPAHVYQRANGIIHLATETQHESFATASEERAQQRRSRGWQLPDPEAFKSVPQTPIRGWPVEYWQRRAFSTAAMWRVLERIRIANGDLPVGPMGNAVDFTEDMGWIGYGLDVAGFTTIVIGQDAGEYGLAAYDFPRYTRVQAAFDDPPLVENTFERVVFSFSLSQAVDPAQTLKNAVPLLRKGGCLIVMLEQGEHELVSVAETALNEAGLTVAREGIRPMGGGVNKIMQRLLNRVPVIPPLVYGIRS
jgi:hypothetical protein